VLDSPSMDELQRLLASCAERADAGRAALVGRDGLVVESMSVTESATAIFDLPLLAAEATDLLAVADRVTGAALDAGTCDEVACRSANAAVVLRRLADGSFVLLLMPADGDAENGRTVLAELAPEFETVLA